MDEIGLKMFTLGLRHALSDEGEFPPRRSFSLPFIFQGGFEIKTLIK